MSNHLNSIMSRFASASGTLLFFFVLCNVQYTPVSGFQCESTANHRLWRRHPSRSRGPATSSLPLQPWSCQLRRYTHLSEQNSVLSLSATSTSSNQEDSSDDQDEKGRPNYRWTSQNFGLAIPALVGMLADPLLSLMDTAYTGRVGSVELAALGACTSIFHLGRFWPIVRSFLLSTGKRLLTLLLSR